ncbi:YgfZ/GcvT domain-containing protein [Sulfitobacter aestuariivivens]|uniref:Folate-binding protein YgfZ n=1 Tax=Sulfitobacter aestuariivivens TaxID=2766981 RepID=A0A927D0H7_9RHOB|nr:folate-binding protein YgfZ [Sulfitobacter aestuariivivens]MBD3662795.1 folate-binding protein YgfZ [Sulfitobacter aestuariivivens]
MPNRRILRLIGTDTRDFLQGLVTNDVTKLDQGLVYAAMLTPQGKYLADFFLVADHDAVLLDVDDSLGDMLSQRLMMYKLRADVQIETAALHMHRGVGDVPPDGHPDPRDAALGWRAYRDMPQTDDNVDWDALYVAQKVPQTGIELTPDTFILEVGFERLSGVDFRKGCYVGQEVTARMKHKTALRKGLAQVRVAGPAEVGTEILTDGKSVGTLMTVSGDRALAYLRFDRAKGDMRAGDAQIVWDEETP